MIPYRYCNIHDWRFFGDFLAIKIFGDRIIAVSNLGIRILIPEIQESKF